MDPVRYRQHVQNGILTSSLMGVGFGMCVALLAKGEGLGGLILTMLVLLTNRVQWAFYRAYDKAVYTPADPGPPTIPSEDDEPPKS